MNTKYERLKRIDGEFGVWNDATKVLPNKNGRYLVVLESEALSKHCQDWGGLGEPETNRFYDGWSYPWSGRGTLVAAFWMPLPEFNKNWNTNERSKGFWTDK